MRQGNAYAWAISNTNIQLLAIESSRELGLKLNQRPKLA